MKAELLESLAQTAIKSIKISFRDNSNMHHFLWRRWRRLGGGTPFCQRVGKFWFCIGPGYLNIFRTDKIEILMSINDKWGPAPPVILFTVWALESLDRINSFPFPALIRPRFFMGIFSQNVKTLSYASESYNFILIAWENILLNII